MRPECRGEAKNRYPRPSRRSGTTEEGEIEGVGIKEVKYAFSTSNETEPTEWTTLEETEGEYLIEEELEEGTYYLWIQATDLLENTESL